MDFDYALDDLDLEFLGDRFVDEGLGRLLGVSFAQYLRATEAYDAQARALKSGFGLNVVAGIARIVPLRPMA